MNPRRPASPPPLQTREKLMQFTPYLNFDGNCAEAFAFYAKLFGGVIAYQSTFGEIPASADMPPMPESAKNRIMHVQLQIKEQSLMGSDSMPGAEATCGGYQPPQGLWVSVHAADEIGRAQV